MMDRRLRMANSSPDVKALFNNSSPYIYHLDEAQESLESQASYLPPPSINEYWPPQPPIARHGRFLSMSHADETLPQSATLARIRLGEGSRASDPAFEQRLKDSGLKPRSLTNRAQSLDLTYSLSRISENAARYPPPDSPTNSIGDTGPSSSPSSATAPSFPSVYGPSSSSRAPMGQGLRGSGAQLDDEHVEEVSRVISNLGL